MSKQVGETVYANYSKHGRVSVKQGEVVAVSPTGVAKVRFNGSSHTVSFQPNGQERGGGWDAAQLVTKEVYDSLAGQAERQKLVSDANNQIRKIVGVGVTKDGVNKADMLRMLEVAMQLVNKL